MNKNTTLFKATHDLYHSVERFIQAFDASCTDDDDMSFYVESHIDDLRSRSNTLGRLLKEELNMEYGKIGMPVGIYDGPMPEMKIPYTDGHREFDEDIL